MNFRSLLFKVKDGTFKIYFFIFKGLQIDNFKPWYIKKILFFSLNVTDYFVIISKPQNESFVLIYLNIVPRFLLLRINLFLQLALPVNLFLLRMYVGTVKAALVETFSLFCLKWKTGRLKSTFSYLMIYR